MRKTMTLIAMRPQVTYAAYAPYDPRARLNWRRAAKSWPVSLSSQAMRFAMAPRSGPGCTPVGLAIRGDRLFQVPVPDLLLRDALPAQPGVRSAQGRGLLPGNQGARLVVEPIAGGADQEPRLRCELAVRVPGQGGKDPDRGVVVAGVEETLPLGQAQAGFIGHGAAL